MVGRTDCGSGETYDRFEAYKSHKKMAQEFTFTQAQQQFCFISFIYFFKIDKTFEQEDLFVCHKANVAALMIILDFLI